MTPSEGEFPFELRRSTPRSVQFTGQGLALACVAVLLILGAVLLGGFLYAQQQKQTALARRMDAEGLATTGTVLDVSWPRDKDQHSSVRFQYVVDGRSYTRQMNVSRRTAQELRVGAEAPVRYLRSNPEQSWVGSRGPDVLPIWIPIAVPLMMGIGPVAIFYRLRKERHLLEEGRTAWGTVTRVGRTMLKNNHPYRIRYEFKILSGQVYRGYWDRQRRPPETGASVIVLYDADNPKCNASYPLQLFRLAES